MPNQDLIFIHISDIHFNKNSGGCYDLDLDLRNEILNDIKHGLQKIGKPSGILICGDIAFSGKKIEYENAIIFIIDVCKILNIQETRVFCVPGNHDVDRNIPEKSPVFCVVQDAIENDPNSDKKLLDYLNDLSYNSQLFKHIHEYNKFAGKFSCNINEKEPNCSLDFLLNDGSILRLWGLNSIIISSHFDTQDRLMVLGEYQIPKRYDGVTYLSLCHHPPECWKNGVYLKDRLVERVNIQLYGHKHILEVSQSVNSLLVGSGATHPSRTEVGWRPRYNWLVIHVEGTDNDRLLEMKLYPRVLNEKNDHFIPDKNICEKGDFKEFSLKLHRWNSTEKIDASLEKLDKNVINVENISQKIISDKVVMNTISNPIRILVYRFLTLSYIARSRILAKFDLVDENDEGVEHIVILEKIMQDAKNRGILKDLWDEINTALDDGAYTENPFID